jgi:hypothetical protein
MATDSNFYQIGTAGSNVACSITCENPSTVLETTCIDLTELVDEGYMPWVPIDPNAEDASADYTHYYISKNETGVITVGACDEELGSDDTVQPVSIVR